jgi:hypothetical protein
LAHFIQFTPLYGHNRKGASRITGNENKLVSDAPIGLFRPKSSSDARKSEFPLTAN